MQVERNVDTLLLMNKQYNLFIHRMQFNKLTSSQDPLTLSLRTSKLEKSVIRSTVTQNTNPLIASSLQLNPSISSISNLKFDKENDELYLLQEENRQLRLEVDYLRQQVKKEKNEKEADGKRMESEIQRLKKLIQKSYYSIKSLEADKETLHKDYLGLKQISEKILNKSKSLEEKKIKLENELAFSKQKHEQEIRIVWSRVGQLEKNIEDAFKIIEMDRQQYKKVQNFYVQNSRVYHKRF